MYGTPLQLNTRSVTDCRVPPEKNRSAHPDVFVRFGGDVAARSFTGCHIQQQQEIRTRHLCPCLGLRHSIPSALHASQGNELTQ